MLSHTRAATSVLSAPPLSKSDVRVKITLSKKAIILKSFLSSASVVFAIYDLYISLFDSFSVSSITAAAPWALAKLISDELDSSAL